MQGTPTRPDIGKITNCRGVFKDQDRDPGALAAREPVQPALPSAAAYVRIRADMRLGRLAMISNEVNEIFREVYRSPRGRDVTDVLKRISLVFAFAVATVAVLALVVISPLMLKWFGSVEDVNWAQLSNIGQTYDAASAMLTAIALIGVAGSIIFQIRAIEVSRTQSVRGQHAHLVEMVLADPVYMRAWGQEPKEYGGLDRYRQQLYVNLILSFWEDNYRLGGSHENMLRGDLAILFRGEAGRDFWAIGRHARQQMSRDHRDKRFFRIVEEEYQKAITVGPPAVRAGKASMTLRVQQRCLLRDSAVRSGTALLVGAMGGIVFKSLMRRRRQ